MTISLEVYEHYYDGDGSTRGPYTIDFPYFDEDDLIVIADGATKTISTHYTVSNGSVVDGHYDGGSITFTVGNAPANDTDNIYIACNTPATQALDYSTLNTFSPSQMELAHDRSVLIARDAKAAANRAGVIATDSLTATFQAFVDAAEASETAAGSSATAAASSASSASSSATAAASSASSASSSATSAASSAASASAIVAGSILPYASRTGSFTAVNNASYWADDGVTVTLPAIGTDVVFRVAPKTSFTTGITFAYTANTINGYSENVVVKTTEALVIYSANGTTWTIVRDFAPTLNVSTSYSTSTKTTDYTLTTDDDALEFNITAQSTLITYAAANASKPHYITNLETSTQKLVINPNGSETVNGASAFDVFPGQSFVLKSNGTNWRLF